jgi:hypothetical protein
VTPRSVTATEKGTGLGSLIDRFGCFITSATHLMNESPSIKSEQEFLDFIKRSQRLLDRPQPVDAFRQFINNSMPLVVAEIKQQLPLLARLAVLSSKWLIQHDLLAVAGFGGVEDAYTELMAWALHPATHPPSAASRQHAWLRKLGLDTSAFKDEVCIPRTQFVTEDGIPDLVLRYASYTVVVEAKTGTTEHVVPSGTLQTLAYPEAVRRKLEIPNHESIEIVFITPAGREAANRAAKITTFIDFAVCLAEALEREPLAADTRAAFALVITHFLTCSLPGNIPVRETITRIVEWSGQPEWTDDECVLAHMSGLFAALRLFQPEKNNEP